jgi:hypothetical protein
MPNDLGFVVAKNSRKIDKLSANLGRSLRPIDEMNEIELMAVPAGDLFVFDVECYKNFFFVAFKHLKSGKYVTFEQSPDFALNVNKLRWMLWRFCIVGFNSKSYDVPIIEYALSGATCEDLKYATDFIIKCGPQYGTPKTTVFDFEKRFHVKINRYNHIDLIEVAPLQGSLKLYAGRLHCDRMQDLPFPDDYILCREDAAVVRPYCCNDLNNTELLFNELAGEIHLRNEMSQEYNVDLRSKSDAQVAEAVINSELQKILGWWPKKPTVSEGTVLQYNVPDFIKFQTQELNDVLNKVRNARFQLDGLGSPLWPAGLGELEKTKGKESKWVLKVKLANSVYKLGMGGLHSQESCIAFKADANTIIADNDVESFYPRIILNQRLYPAHLGEAFLQVYEKIVNARIYAKAQAKACEKAHDRAGKKHWKQIADSLKITINGSFGKLGNKYSTLYAPQLMLQVTITGQLVLLMLIERLNLANINVVSGNTDGIVSVYETARHNEVRAIIAQWESETNFKTEETRYSQIYSRDVNNYVAVKLEGGDAEARFLDERLGCKTKGTYSERGSALNSVLSKNPESLICTDAMLQYIVSGKPVIETIKECTDIKRFVSVRNVKGGGEKNGKYLGKVVRWYYPKNEPGYIAYLESGNKVNLTQGGRPLMDLPDAFPSDVDYEYYAKQATAMLYECGCLKKPKTAPLFF